MATKKPVVQPVHTRYAYNVDDILFDRRFADLFAIDPATGQRYLDFEKFDTTEPPLPPVAQAVEIATSIPVPGAADRA